uniref:Uncharacterized protein n=1 Tax=Nitzschia sp. IriIs04 TaxID=1444690 RepID=A0A0S3QPJ6_9STRA|nr:hypothetical protein [Nitzschia sp. IriIs04]BAT70260.1 hypothetical protein [Nitzschia sp. IriIs04]
MKINIYTAEKKTKTFTKIRNNILLKHNYNSLTIQHKHIPIVICFLSINLFFESEENILNKNEFIKINNGFLSKTDDEINFYCTNFEKINELSKENK